MSFFGFDPSAPPSGRNNGKQEVYEFQDTYEGLDEAGDAFNDETFGTSTGDIRKDFDFGSGAGTAGSASAQSAPAPSSGVVSQGVSYAQVAAATDDEFMQDLWGTNTPIKHESPATAGERKILSLEEIEAQLTAIEASVQPVPPQQQQQQQNQGQFMQPSFMMPPPQFGYMMPPPPGAYMPPPPPPHQYGQMPGWIPPPPMGVPPQPIGQPVDQQVPQQQPITPAVQSAQPLEEGQVVDHQEVPTSDEAGNDIDSTATIASSPPRKVDLADFPVLGSKEAHDAQHHPHRQHHYQQQQQQHHPAQLQSQVHPPQHTLTPEEQERAARRQEKVSRIMKYSGIMNPKDKDFVTRFQLSQIVTEDPYNEDFYAQVYKVIHPKNDNAPIGNANNSIAQAYLEQSGHRLGGRYKRADVALQRMQQQVQKAVTVARERPKLTQYAKEGALGKISFGTGKKPRQQLEIISKAAERERSGEVKKDKEEITSYSKKDILNSLEGIITELMNVESETRASNDLDTSKLWDSLKVLEHASCSGDPEAEVNPFIQCLNYNKMLKILSRLFKFLNREQILTISTLIMSNLENLAVIKHGSYTTYPDKRVPDNIAHLVDSYSMTFSKVLMNAVLDFKFNEIIGLLVILIEHNNVSFVSTTKIGLSILTTLLSRAELIIGEGTISATDLSEWSSCYDELFTSLESRIAAIFPPHPEDVDDGSSRENYVWQFLATLSLGGKLSHQRIIVDEVRDEIFGVMSRAKAIDAADVANLYRKQNLLNNLNMYLVVMGLVADENEIKELQS
ncbi:DNA topoisomerase 2-associated protein PAT1 [Spathaspora sp. JA1]|nr:DNA topoisomerase 2-associated protein PAT1 [Spathaspora sp. JA1]